MQGRPQAAADGAGEHQHLVHRDRDGVAVAEDVVGGGVADQHDVDPGVLDDRGGRVVVRGDHDDRLAQRALLGELEEGDRGAAHGVGRTLTAPFGSAPRRSGVAALSMRTLSIRRVVPMVAATTIEVGRAPGRCRGRRRRSTRARCRARPAPLRPASRSPSCGGSQGGIEARGPVRARSGVRRALRLDSARPSGSRTVGWTRSRSGKSRSRDHALAGPRPAGRPSGRSRRASGCDHVEQLRDDGADAGEVARAAVGALEDVGEARDDRRSCAKPAG